MTETLIHRGPDDEGYHLAGPVGFGFRRLSILDLTNAGHQPMLSPDGDVALVFNGEIFNYLELRATLESLGHSFRSTGDAEVLLKSYLEWGKSCVEKFNGEWAFIIYDKSKHILFGSRDRFGIKPLYRVETTNEVVWTSEIKAILALPTYQKSIDWITASAYFDGGQIDHAERTFFEGVRAIPAATAFTIGLNGIENRWKYWSIPEKIENNNSANCAEEFGEIFEDAVRLRLRSDVPVAVCLSGGLDSTAIICAMARCQHNRAESINAFTYHNDEYDEQLYIDATIEQTGASLQKLIADPHGLWDMAEKMLRIHDEPVHSLTAMVGFQLMQMIAASGVKVVLNGQGADEAFAGYDSYFQDAWYGAARRGHLKLAWSEINKYTSVHGGQPSRMFIATIIRMLRAPLGKFDWYRALSHWKKKTEAEDRGWFTGAALNLGDTPNAKSYDLRNVLERAIANDPLPNYLRIEDRNSMSNSVEVRLPWLDYRLLEYAFPLSDDWKINGPWNKYIVRESLRGRIPDIVRTREDKMGFPVGMQNLMHAKSLMPLTDIIDSPTARSRGIYNNDKILKELRQYRDKPNTSIAYDTFRIAQFEIWAQAFDM